MAGGRSEAPSAGSQRERRGWSAALARLLALLARPVRRARVSHGVALEPYRGYGSREQIFMIGRVFRQSSPASGPKGIAGHLRDIGRRIARRPVRNAVVRAEFCGASGEFATDADGYFRVNLAPAVPPPGDRCWHGVALEVTGASPVRASGEVFIPPPGSRFVVISDIDDTVVETGVANTARMLWRLFVEDAGSRVAFPGVSALYRALHEGGSGEARNPMLYVSRAPWGTYDVLDAFFHLNDIPVGPILFLREWGISWRSPWPRRAESHKRDLIAHMLALYHDLPFVLIGDSGQHDPEIYRQVVEEHPGRVLAVYIRNVSRNPARLRQIEDLAAAVARAGSSLVLAADSAAMALHAEGLGLVPAGTADRVRQERRREGGPSGRPWRTVSRTTPGETATAVEKGGLGTAISDGPPESPPNVLVEPSTRPPRRGGRG